MSTAPISRAKAQITMAAAAVIFLGGTAYGAQLLTAKSDPAADGPTCEPRTVKAGEDVTSNLVTVNVYNASQRSGLANRVNINLQRNGFLGGHIGNADDVLDKDVQGNAVAIVTADKDDPQVKLVAEQFK
ncbi:MAG: LytR C-terminal domain-containing protein, partial [Aeromicrobium sp.]